MCITNHKYKGQYITEVTDWENFDPNNIMIKTYRGDGFHVKGSNTPFKTLEQAQQYIDIQ